MHCVQKNSKEVLNTQDYNQRLSFSAHIQCMHTVTVRVRATPLHPEQSRYPKQQKAEKWEKKQTNQQTNKQTKNS